MINNKYFKIHDLTYFRTEIMGIATILILLYHSNFKFILFKIADIGVDIFLFLSGFGCFLSLSKDYNIFKFFKKRIIRVVIPYLIVFVPYYFFISLDEEGLLLKFVYFIYRISTLNFWLNDVITSWFVAGIIFLYVITPFLYKKIVDNKITIKTVAYFAIFLCIITIFSKYYLSLSTAKVILFNRFHSYLFGMLLAARYIDNNEKINKINIINSYIIIIVFLIIAIISKLLINELSYIFMSLVSPLVCLSIANYLRSIYRFDYIVSLLKFMGTASLEFYLIYERVLILFDINSFFNIMSAIVLTTFLVIALKNIEKKISVLLVGKNVKSKLYG